MMIIITLFRFSTWFWAQTKLCKTDEGLCHVHLGTVSLLSGVSLIKRLRVSRFRPVWCSSLGKLSISNVLESYYRSNDIHSVTCRSLTQPCTHVHSQQPVFFQQLVIWTNLWVFEGLFSGNNVPKQNKFTVYCTHYLLFSNMKFATILAIALAVFACVVSAAQFKDEFEHVASKAYVLSLQKVRYNNR